jgi:hypothetical protein
MTHRSIFALFAAGFLAACGGAEPEAVADGPPSGVGNALAVSLAAPVCRIADAALPLPDEVRESSGLARSARDPELFWTHNDAGSDPYLFALDGSGRLVQQVRVTGAELADWEDMDAGPCASGSCLFVGDIGDNDGDRERVTIYRLAEPGRGASESAGAEALHARFPEGPQDAESLFLLPSGDLFIVTKGRGGPVVLYRFPAPQQIGQVATLERVRELFPEPGEANDRVTGAGASPDGRWVGIRSYRKLYLFPSADLVGRGAVEPTEVDLAPLNESQGESVVIADDGTVWLTSEAESRSSRSTLSRMSCTFPAE